MTLYSIYEKETIATLFMLFFIAISEEENDE